MDKINKLKETIDKASKDACKFFEKNNRAAGVRARKKLQKCKKYIQHIRKLIQQVKYDYAQKKSFHFANKTASTLVELFNKNAQDEKNSPMMSTQNNFLTEENTNSIGYIKPVSKFHEYDMIEIFSPLDK
nr:histone H1 [Cryptomonas paramecium]